MGEFLNAGELCAKLCVERLNICGLPNDHQLSETEWLSGYFTISASDEEDCIIINMPKRC